MNLRAFWCVHKAIMLCRTTTLWASSTAVLVFTTFFPGGLLSSPPQRPAAKSAAKPSPRKAATAATGKQLFEQQCVPCCQIRREALASETSDGSGGNGKAAF